MTSELYQIEWGVVIKEHPTDYLGTARTEDELRVARGVALVNHLQFWIERSRRAEQHRNNPVRLICRFVSFVYPFPPCLLLAQLALDTHIAKTDQFATSDSNLNTPCPSRNFTNLFPFALRHAPSLTHPYSTFFPFVYHTPRSHRILAPRFLYVCPTARNIYHDRRPDGSRADSVCCRGSF